MSPEKLDVLAMRELPVLERSQATLSTQHFYALLGITSQQVWLERKQPQLVELYQLCDNDEQRNLVLDLLSRFRYFTGRDIEESCHRLANTLTTDWLCTPKNTILAAVASDTDPDGSQSVLQFLKQVLPNSTGWTSKNFYSNLDDALSQCKSNTNLVLVEDFIGTGQKIFAIQKKVNECLAAEQKTNVDISLLVVSIMEGAKPALDASNIRYSSSHSSSRGITDHFAAESQRKEMLQTIRALSAKLAHKYKGQWMEPLGKKKSETLIYFEPVSIPNNVFPIFWWPTLKDYSKRNPLFNRHR